MNKRFMLGFKNFQFNETETPHINKMPFSGTVAFVDTPSDGSPCGADGMKVAFDKAAVEKAIGTFVGMGVNCVWSEDFFSNPASALTGHDERFKVGIVEAAEVDGNEVKVSGFLWRYDFSDVCRMIKNAKESLGFSVEIVADKVEERDGHLLVTDLVFTGLAILYADCGAFKQTRLIAQRSDMMNEEQVKALIADAVGTVEAKFADMVAAADAKAEEAATKLSAANDEIAGLKEQLAGYESLKAENEALKTESAEMKEKVDGLSIELSDVKASKQDKAPERKSVQFNTLAKYGEDKTVDVLCKEISEDKDLSPSQKWALKLQAWKKDQAAE